MHKKSVHIRIVCVTLLLIILAGVCSVDAGKFNMSYLYGNYNYTNLIKRTNNSLNEVSPSYFDLNSDGTLCLNTIDENFVSNAHKMGVKVVPFLSNHWDRAKGREALSNIEKLTTQIVNAIEKYNLDGVNVDIENVTNVDRENYTKLVKRLREKLSPSKTVSVAVAANPNGWNQGWHASYDYAELSNYADYIMVMAYDEHYESGEAGSVASIQFVEKSIKYALKYVSKDKVVLGIPFYGRYWKNSSSYGGYGVSLNKIDTLVKKYKSNVVYDNDSQSVKATITISSSDTKPTINGRTLYAGTYTFWYENEQSIKAKIALVNKYDIKGTGSWSLGQECEETWSYYMKALNNSENMNEEFIDVDEKRWSYEDIMKVKQSGYMNGKNNYEFAPTEYITRAEFAVTIARALNLEIKEISISSYQDTKEHWAKNYIEAVREAGIMIGYGDGNFRPNAQVTREEVAKVLSLLKLSGLGMEGTIYFKDVSPTEWSYTYVLDVTQKGFMKGYPNNTFMPQNNITREEIATVISRAFKL